MDCTAVRAVPYYRGAWKEGVYVLGSVAGRDTEASVVPDAVIHDICGVEVSLLPGLYESARLLGC